LRHRHAAGRRLSVRVSSLAGVLAGTEGEILDAVRTGFDVAHRVLVEPDRIPFADLDDLIGDLDAAGAANDDVDPSWVSCLWPN
jgi:hypothetical protein